MMTPQESQALQELLTQLTQVQGVTKDAQASNMIGAAFARQPDAGYLLVQRTMLQDQALGTARAQISQLQSQLQAERESRAGAGGGTGGGFLDPSSAWGNSAANAGQGGFSRTPAPLRNQPQAAAPMAQQYADPQAAQYAAQPARPGLFGGGGGSSFLGSMAATAAGVAGGAFLFQGIESLMGHHGGGSGLMGQSGQSPVENTTINNFYGSDAETTASAEPERLLSDASDSSSDVRNDDFAGNDDVGGSDDMSSI